HVVQSLSRPDRVIELLQQDVMMTTLLQRQGGLLVDMHTALARPLRIACVTETYPPEVNGVAMTIARLVEGLRLRRHDVQVIRPRQSADGAGMSLAGDVLVRGVPIPRYAGLRMGLPCKRELVKMWKRERPDVVHIATEGPLGWSALRAACALGLP